MTKPDLRLFTTSDVAPDREPFEDLPTDSVSEAQARASLHGREFKLEACEFVEQLGARIIDTDFRVEEGYHIDAELEGVNGRRFYLDAHGTPDRADRPQAGIRRQDTILKFGFKALRLHQRGSRHPLLLVTSHLPRPNTSAAFLLAELGDVLLDAVAVTRDAAGAHRLSQYFRDPLWAGEPISAHWRRSVQLQLDLDPFADDCESADPGARDA